MNIVEDLLNHSRLALTKGITAVENEYDNAVEIMTRIYPHTGHAYVIGITGPPGAGKSTLTDGIAKEYRKRGKTVGRVAVDPTSPFSGGAILGDRIRMMDLMGDTGIFIRSMATRGSLGGLSQKAGDAVKLMDAFGMDVIIVETVGVGQSEVDIVKTADTTMVVVIPGMGDDIQAIKAGILEIGDLITINKADRDGTEKLNIEMEMMLELNQAEVKWRPPINQTVASKGEGLQQVVKRRKRIHSEVTDMINTRVNRYIEKKIVKTQEFDTTIEQLQKHETNPYSVVDEIVQNVLK